MGTLSDLQQKAVEDELRHQQLSRDKAKRVVAEHAKAHGWPEEDQLQVEAMLGLHLSPSMVNTGTPRAAWNGFNNG